ncbi:MAG TPA: ATP-binding protein [Gemmatimonadaceae bacterium]
MSPHTFEHHIVRSAAERTRARQFIARVSWTLLIVLLAIAGSLWFAPMARHAGHLRVLRALSVGFIVEFFALIGLLVLLRRRLADQSTHADAQHDLLVRQNERLKAQNRDLEIQADSVQQQAVELELQSTELQEHAEALEAKNAELEESQSIQRELLDRLRLLNRRLNEGQRLAQVAYWEIDGETGSVFWSDEMYRLCGIQRTNEPPPTDRFMDAVHPEDQPRMRVVAERAMTELSEFTEQYRIRTPDRGLRTVQAAGRVLVDDGGFRKLVGTIQDVTDRVALESQLRQAQKMEAVGQLAGGIAHDFNNMLTVIEGYTSLLLLESKLDAPSHEFVNEIRAAAERAAALTRQLLTFSRQEVRRPRVLNVNEAIRGVSRMLARLIGENIEVHMRLTDRPPLIFADAGQVEQILANLVINARDAMPDGGQLTIETAHVELDATFAQRRRIERPGPYVVLAVSDTGSGIPPELIERVFEPFFTTKPSGKGTGLGLSTVYGIVEQSGGRIWVYSEMGHGTSFKIYFPLSTGEADADAVRTESPPVLDGTETVLLVEDDVALRRVAARSLERAGYTVIQAEDAAQALEVCADADRAIAAVVSDVMMPGMSGVEFRDRVRAARPGLPVLLMSGYTRDAANTVVNSVGEDVFIEKPFTPAALAAKVREVIDRG